MMNSHMCLWIVFVMGCVYCCCCSLLSFYFYLCPLFLLWFKRLLLLLLCSAQSMKYTKNRTHKNKSNVCIVKFFFRVAVLTEMVDYKEEWTIKIKNIEFLLECISVCMWACAFTHFRWWHTWLNESSITEYNSIQILCFYTFFFLLLVMMMIIPHIFSYYKINTSAHLSYVNVFVWFDSLFLLIYFWRAGGLACLFFSILLSFSPHSARKKKI